MSKVDEALEYSKVAQQFAANAMVSVRLQGLLIETILNVLRDTGTLPVDSIHKVFLGAAAVLDDAQPDSEMEKETVHEMRRMIAQLSNDYGLELPPPGQIDLPRKH